MNSASRILLFALFAFSGWASCSASESTPEPDCKIDDDCLDGYVCTADTCVARINYDDIPCVDGDEDGFGVGIDQERQNCERCVQFGQCGEDCNDDDASINPGEIERCNDLDDNCNSEVDEPSPCDNAGDCQALLTVIPPNTQPTCRDGFCEVVMDTQFCGDMATCPCNADALSCTDGTYPAVPDPSECL